MTLYVWQGADAYIHPEYTGTHFTQNVADVFSFIWVCDLSYVVCHSHTDKFHIIR